MKKKRSFADHVRDLTEVAPSVEPGEEYDDLGTATLGTEGQDDMLQGSSGRNRGLGVSGRLPLRASVPEGKGVYGGLKTSKRALLGHSSNSEGTNSDRSEVELPGPEANNQQWMEPASSDSDQSLGSPGLSPDPGGEAAGLDSQYEQLEAADMAELRADVRRRRLRDAKRGAAVANQRRVWERVLELRILLQKALTASHRLPASQGREVSAQVREVQEGYKQLTAQISGGLRELLDLHTALIQQIPSLSKVPAGGLRLLQWRMLSHRAADHSQPGDQGPGQQGGATTAHAGASLELWPRLSAAQEEIRQYRDATLDQWHRQVMLLGGSAAMRGNMKSLGQGISAQVQAAMANPERLIAHTLLAVDEAPRQLCDPTAAGNQQHEQAREPCFDDSAFYGQLLQEFLEVSGVLSGTAAPPVHKASKKRPREQRSSKGRRLRYNIQDKLVNFMAPVNSAAPPVAFQLFRTLFGTHDAAHL